MKRKGDEEEGDGGTLVGWTNPRWVVVSVTWAEVHKTREESSL